MQVPGSDNAGPGRDILGLELMSEGIETLWEPKKANGIMFGSSFILSEIFISEWTLSFSKKFRYIFLITLPLLLDHRPALFQIFAAPVTFISDFIIIMGKSKLFVKLNLSDKLGSSSLNQFQMRTKEASRNQNLTGIFCD